MNDKKHIDRLFQEKFKDFEMTPDASLWEGIESRLDKPKRKKRIIPIWLRYGGVAAALIMFLAIGNLFVSDDLVKDNTIVDTKTEENTSNNNTNIESKNSDIYEKEKIEGVVENTDNTSANFNTNNTDSKSTERNLITSEEASKALQNKTNLNPSYNNSNTTVVDNLNSNTSSSDQNKTNNNANNYGNFNTDTVTHQSQKDRISNKQKNNSLYVQNTEIMENEENSTNNRNATVANIDKVVKEQTNTTTPKLIDEKTTAVSNTNIVANNTNEKEEEKKIDKDIKKTSETIEEAIAKIEDLDEKEEVQIDRWSVNANVAPVYYNTLGKGSHIHDQFIDNPKDGETNTSYGIKVGYALNKKIKVRSGVNMLDLSYDTANVIVYNTVSSSSSELSVNSPNNSDNNATFRNIKFVPDSNGQTFSLLSRDNLGVQQISSLVNEKLNAALSQRISYIEVPLELEYALVDNKLGINLIGGASAFFLDSNEVVSEIEDRKTKIGEANNIEKVSYSANIGLGIDYNFSDKLKFNLEPTFKYQMSAYSETSGDFRPYIVGVYTGFSYKF